MNSKNILLLILLLFLYNHMIFSQDCESFSDTVFMININIIEVGKPPNAGMFIIDDLNKIILNKENIDNFVCIIYSNSQYIIPPSFGYENNLMRCYADSSESVYNKAVNNYYQSVHDLYKRSFEINFFLNDSTKIRFKLFKISAEFWKIPIKEHGLNEFSDQVHISSECYNEPILYSIKAFKEIYKLSKSEKKYLKNKLKANTTF